MSGGSFLENLTGAYSGLRRSVVDPETGQPVVTSAAAAELRPDPNAITDRSWLLPVGRTAAGDVVPAAQVPVKFLGERVKALPEMATQAIEAARYPGQVYRGEASVFDPATGHVSDEAVGKAFDIAGTAMTGSLPMRAPRGALRSFGGAAAKGDPLAALELTLKDIPQEAPRPGPRLLDPQAKSWDVFHGSPAGEDFARFDPAKNANPHEQGVFFAPSGETASDYAGKVASGGEAGARVFRATVEPGKTGVFDLTRLAETDPAFNARAREITVEGSGAAHGASWDEHMTGFRASRAQDADIARQIEEMGFPPDPNAGTRISYGHGHIGAAIERARAQGLDTAILRGLVEHGGDDQLVALTPGRVRSRYGGDLLYSTAPAALGAGAVAAATVAGSGEAKAAPSNKRKPMPGFFDDVPMAVAPAAPPAGPTPSPGGASRARTNFFDDVPFANAGGAAPGGAGSAVPAPAPGSEASADPSVLADMVQGAGAGIIRGAGGLVDLPQAVLGIFDTGFGAITNAGAGAVRSAMGKAPLSEAEVERARAAVKGGIPLPQDLPRPGAAAIGALEDATGKLYEPQTRAGKFARTAAEFVPGAGRKLGEVLALGIGPGLASEGAGQLTEGSALEPWARGGAAVGAGLGGAVVRARTSAEGMASRRAQGATAEQVDQAEALFREAAERGLPLTRANALDAVSGGVTSLSDLQRVVEGTGRLRGFFAPTAEGVRREGEGVLDTIAPAGANPSVLGGELQDAARSAVAATPQGTALTQTLDAAGPRVSPEQAGRVIQPELQRAYDRREGMRAALGERDYRAAEAAPERIGIDRTVRVERPGEPVVTQARPSRPAFTEEAVPPLPPAPAVGAEGRPESILQYLSRNGGIPLDAEARAADLHRTYVPGGGALARNGAPSWDDIRVRLTEGGFLPYDAAGAASAADVRDLVLGAIQRERIGRGRQVRMADEGRPEARRGQESDEYRAALSEAERRLDTDLTAAGVPIDSVHPDIRSRTLNALVRGETTDPLEAFERTVMAMRENPAPFSRSTTVSEEVSAPRFGHRSRRRPPSPRGRAEPATSTLSPRPRPAGRWRGSSPRRSSTRSAGSPAPRRRRPSGACCASAKTCSSSSRRCGTGFARWPPRMTAWKS